MFVTLRDTMRFNDILEQVSSGFLLAIDYPITNDIARPTVIITTAEEDTEEPQPVSSSTTTTSLDSTEIDIQQCSAGNDITTTRYIQTNDDDQALPYTPAKGTEDIIKNYCNVHRALLVFNKKEEVHKVTSENFGYIIGSEKNSYKLMNNDKSLLFGFPFSMGRVNEYEISSNFNLKNPVLPDKDVYDANGNLVVVTNERRYYPFKVILIVSGDKLIGCDSSSVSGTDDEEKPTCTRNLILRIDSINDEKKQRVTSKLRLYRKKFSYMNMEFSVSANIESFIPQLVFDEQAILGCYKIRKFVYWNVELLANNQKFNMKIAFRKRTENEYGQATTATTTHAVSSSNHPSNDVECNIECEDCIAFELFAELYIALAGYYTFQVITFPTLAIEPIMSYSKFKIYKNSVHYTALTDVQKIAIDSIKLVKWVDDEGLSKSNQSVLDLISTLGLSLYSKHLKSMPDNSNPPIIQRGNIDYNISLVKN